jgi:nucleotide-binding universal stress UspA family protein
MWCSYARHRRRDPATSGFIVEERVGTIVVAVDFEAASDRAIAVAEGLARATSGEVVLLHVFTPPLETYPGLEPSLTLAFRAEACDPARRNAEDLAKDRCAQALFRRGDAAFENLATADDVAPDLLVVGTYGGRGISRLLLGSVDEKVVRQARCPVMIVKAA